MKGVFLDKEGKLFLAENFIKVIRVKSFNEKWNAFQTERYHYDKKLTRERGEEIIKHYATWKQWEYLGELNG